MDKDQLAFRRTGITASEAPILAGLTPFGKTPWDVWAEKKNLVEPKPPTLAQRRGKRMERIVAEIYAEEYARSIRWLDTTTRSPKHSFLLATPDFVHMDGPEGGEVKYPRFRSEVWGEEGTDEVPEHILCQATIQMIVMGWPSVVVVAMFGGQDIRRYPVPFHGELAGSLLETCGRFWTDHVLADVPPAIDYSEAARAYTMSRFPKVENPVRAATEHEAKMAAAFRHARYAKKAAELLHDTMRNQLLEMIGPAKGIEGDGFRITAGEVKGSTYTVVRKPTRVLRATFANEEPEEEK